MTDQDHRTLPPTWATLGDTARALGNDRRLAILEALAASAVPLEVKDLVERLDFHHLSVREHLVVLCEAGLVVEEAAAPARGGGRPPRSYRPVPGALERWTGDGPHAELAAMLLQVLSGRSAREVGADHGRALAGRLATDDPVERLDAVMRRLGFEPTRSASDGPLELELHQCPFLDLAAAAPEVVCELHRGIADGVADRPGQALQVRSLSLGSPPATPCRLVFDHPSSPADDSSP